MAFIGKNVQKPKPGQTVFGRTHVTRAAASLPQTSTDILFRVYNGAVRITLMYGTVTTVIQNSDPVAKVSSKALSTASVAIGTAVDIASTVDINSLEVGGFVVVEGDGTALVKSNAGNAFIGAVTGNWICPQGEIYLTTGASKTGALKWDLVYEPIDEGAYVLANAVQTVI